MAVNTVEELLAHQFQDMYSASLQFRAALSKLAGYVDVEQVSRHIDSRRQTLKAQAERIEKLAAEYQFPVDGKQCAAADGIIREIRDIYDMTDATVRDLATLGALRRMACYGMAGYTTCLRLAEKLGYADSAEVAQTALDEDRSSNNQLETADV